MNRQLLVLLSAVVFGYSCSSQPEENRKPDVFDDQVSREDSIQRIQPTEIRRAIQNWPAGSSRLWLVSKCVSFEAFPFDFL